MGKVIDFNSIKSKKDEEEVDEQIEQINMAQTAIAMILGKLDVGFLEGTVAMQMLVNKIIEDKEWDEEVFNKYVTQLAAINNDEELH
tara:strand:+ start:424 stop:684 length:261 start_codon:yes stop_codon:yes gene_type:complete